ncbi:MAG: HdeD family acid-resistance protein [Planctomycetota bacterium]|jgi:uncharacterized membrane protein HdeD (DUF308 family)
METGLEELGDALPGQMAAIRKRWPWLIALGVLLIILGFVTIGAPFIGITAIKQLIGWTLLAVGVARGVHAVFTPRKGRVLLDLVIGIVQIAVGVFLLTRFLAGAFTVVTLLVSLFTMDGLARIVISFRLRLSPLRAWLRVTGLLSFVLGLMVLLKLPSAQLWAVGLVVGVNLALDGWTMIIFAITAGPLAEDADALAAD